MATRFLARVHRVLRGSVPVALCAITIPTVTVVADPAFAQAQDSKPQPSQPASQADAPSPARAFPDDPLALVAEANKYKAQANYDEAAKFYQRALQLDSRSFEAHLGLGMVLDLQGSYGAAETELNKALAMAPENAPEQRDTVLTALAVSYAFRGDIDGAQRYYERLYDFQIATQRIDKAASTAQTIGRAYLDVGDTPRAAQWYQTGQEAVRKMSGLPGDQVDLWQMRWEQAQSRIAARSGNPEEAETHLAAMKALIDKGGPNVQQSGNYQYLVGYNAFYAGNYDEAIAALQKADPRDPTILTMLAAAYAKKGDPAAAQQYVDRVAILPMHTLQGAMARQDIKKIEQEIEKLKAEQQKAAEKKPEKPNEKR